MSEKPVNRPPTADVSGSILFLPSPALWMILYDNFTGLFELPASAPLQQVQAQIRHKQGPHYGLPPHLFRFELELASAPALRGDCILLSIISLARSSLTKIKKQNALENKSQLCQKRLC